jgi:hypothetical protein
MTNDRALGDEQHFVPVNAGIERPGVFPGLDGGVLAGEPSVHHENDEVGDLRRKTDHFHGDGRHRVHGVIAPPRKCLFNSRIAKVDFRREIATPRMQSHGV